MSTAGLIPGLSQLGQQHQMRAARPAPASPLRAADARPAARPRRPRPPSQQQGDGQHGGPAPRARASPRTKATKFYRIVPPEGRHHDSLWEIAQRHLGDGRRYKEIYELNKDRVQPDGSRLSQASLIRPGWVMEMPADATGGDLVQMPVAAPHTAPDIEHYAQHGGAKDTAAEGAHAADADPGRRPGRRARAAAAARRAASTAGDGRAPSTGLSASHGFDLSEALIAAPLLAAGLLAALGRRRRTALWQSLTAGALRTPRTPTGPEADVADALRIGADQEAVDFLDRALRALSARLDADDRKLPTVYAAWLTDDALHLQLAWPEGEPPAPWRLGQDQTFWQLERADLAEDADMTAAAPYPGLVVLGTLDGGAAAAQPRSGARHRLAVRAARPTARPSSPRSPPNWPPTAGRTG